MPAEMPTHATHAVLTIFYWKVCNIRAEDQLLFKIRPELMYQNDPAQVLGMHAQAEMDKVARSRAEGDRPSCDTEPTPSSIATAGRANAPLTFIYLPDSIAANVLRIGPNVVMQEGFPESEALVSQLCKERGLVLHTLCMAELIKADGALTCCSVLFKLQTAPQAG